MNPWVVGISAYAFIALVFVLSLCRIAALSDAAAEAAYQRHVARSNA